MDATSIILIIEALAGLAKVLSVEDREATVEELQAAGLGSQEALDNLKAEIARKRQGG